MHAFRILVRMVAFVSMDHLIIHVVAEKDTSDLIAKLVISFANFFFTKFYFIAYYNIMLLNIFQSFQGT